MPFEGSGWRQVNGVWIKKMKYLHSSFPCCLQMALFNLHYANHDDSIETAWNGFSMEQTGKGLDSCVLDEEQTKCYLSRTQTFGNKGVIYSPSPIQPDTVQNVAEQITRDFIEADGPAALILGIKHTHLLYKTRKEWFRCKIIHITPSPVETDSAVLEELAAVDVPGEHVIRLSDNKDFLLSADHLMLIR